MKAPAAAVIRRDPFGQAPLCYARAAGGRLAVAGSVRELAALAGLTPRIERAAAARALCGVLGPGESLFAGLHRLPPGHALLPDGPTVPWWEPPLPMGQRPDAGREITGSGRAGELLRLLREAVLRRLAPGDTAACPLSDGIDSGGLLAILARERPGVRAWTLVDDAAGVAETDRARLLAARPGVEHVEVRVREEEDVRTAPKAPRLAAPGGCSPRARRRWSDFYHGGLTRTRLRELGIVDHGRVAALLDAFARTGDDDPRRPVQDAVLMRLASLAVLSHRSTHHTAAAHVEAPAGGTAG